jgi:two-component system chemotaxis response regulator CheY
VAKKSLKILIVDDIAVARDLLRAMLRSLHVTEILDASNGHDAVALYQRARPDIVFLDIRMPGKDGLQALFEILAIDPNAFVVIDSADSTADNVRAALKGGARGFMVKPYNMQKVRDILEQYAAQRAARRSAPRDDLQSPPTDQQ